MGFEMFIYEILELQMFVLSDRIVLQLCKSYFFFKMIKIDHMLRRILDRV